MSNVRRNLADVQLGWRMRLWAMAELLRLRTKVAKACDSFYYCSPLGRPHSAATAASINSRISLFSAADCSRFLSSMRRLSAMDSAVLASCHISAKKFKAMLARATKKMDAIRTKPDLRPIFFGHTPATKETNGINGRIRPAKTNAAITTLREAYGTKSVEGSNTSRTIAGPPAIGATASKPSQIVFTSSNWLARFTSSGCGLIPHSLLDVRQMVTRYGGEG